MTQPSKEMVEALRLAYDQAVFDAEVADLKRREMASRIHLLIAMGEHAEATALLGDMTEVVEGVHLAQLHLVLSAQRLIEAARLRLQEISNND